MKREAYLDCEKPLPDFERGDLVRYVTQSNFIIQYEILQKNVLEIEEINEYNQHGEHYGADEEVFEEFEDEDAQDGESSAEDNSEEESEQVDFNN